MTSTIHVSGTSEILVDIVVESLTKELQKANLSVPIESSIIAADEDYKYEENEENDETTFFVFVSTHKNTDIKSDAEIVCTTKNEVIRQCNDLVNGIMNHWLKRIVREQEEPATKRRRIADLAKELYDLTRT